MIVINITLSILIFLFICNWFQLLSFIEALSKPRANSKTINDKWIFDTIQKKTGLKLQKIYLFDTPKLFGMMPGIPLKPIMILSRGLYEAFNKDEIEWVILHEAGHCVLWHNLQALLIEVFFLGIIWFTVHLYALNMFISILLAITVSLICIQVIRRLIEYEADKFSITRVGNPKGVITAQQKFLTTKYKNLFYKENSLGRQLLHWNILPPKRIAMAKVEILKKQITNEK